MTAVLGDRNPCDLHLFRNYDPPGKEHVPVYSFSGAKFENPPKPDG